MKDILEYSREDLEALDTDKLLELYHEAEMMEEQKSTGQLTKKVLINSLYGALANVAFILFNEKIAQAITGNGRFFIQKTANMIERALQEKLPSPKKFVCYGDTDSVYYQIAPYVELYMKKQHGNTDIKGLSPEEKNSWIEEETDFCDNFAEKVVQPIIDQSIKEMALCFNAYNPARIGAKREVIASEAAFVAKKKYVMRVRVDEGTRFPVDNPHTKVMGLELAKSTTPIWVKEKLSEAVNIILDSDDVAVRDYIREIKKEYLDQPIENIAGVLSCKDVSSPFGEDINPNQSITKFKTEGTVHYGRKMAFVYNNYLEHNKLKTQYLSIEPGDKFKFVHLKTPNPFNNNKCIGFITSDFAEKYVKEYIDYDTQFEKTFLSSLRNMTDKIGYNTKQQTATLLDW